VPKEVLETNPEQHLDHKAAREARIAGDASAFTKDAAAAKQKNDASMAAFVERNSAGRSLESEAPALTATGTASSAPASSMIDRANTGAPARRGAADVSGTVATAAPGQPGNPPPLRADASSPRQQEATGSTGSATSRTAQQPTTPSRNSRASRGSAPSSSLSQPQVEAPVGQGGSGSVLSVLAETRKAFAASRAKRETAAASRGGPPGESKTEMDRTEKPQSQIGAFSGPNSSVARPRRATKPPSRQTSSKKISGPNEFAPSNLRPQPTESQGYLSSNTDRESASAPPKQRPPNDQNVAERREVFAAGRAQRRNAQRTASGIRSTGGSDSSAKKTGEPPQLIAGKIAHQLEEIRPGEAAEVLSPSGKGRMDRYDAKSHHIREINPDNPKGIRDGLRQLKRYKAEMEKATGHPHTIELTTYPTTKPKP